MSKSKKSRLENKSHDEDSSSASSSDLEDSGREKRQQRKQTKKSAANTVKKQRDSSKESAAHSSKSDSSASSDSAESLPERKSRGTVKETGGSSKRAENIDNKRGESSRSKELAATKNRGDVPNMSKWDSPDRQRSRRQRSSSRNRQRSTSRNRQQHQQRHNSGERSWERGKERERVHHDRPERNERARGNYTHKDESADRRDYRPRSDIRYRGNRSRVEHEQRNRNDHHNERRERSHSRSRSPRRDRYARDERIKREPQHSPTRSRQRYNNRRHGSREDDNKEYEWGGKRANAKTRDSADTKPPVEKEKPNFGLSGVLAEETNKVNGIVVKYAEPPEARKPKRRWRLYPFKGETALPTLHIHRQSCFLVGRDRKVADLAVDHPSCSKQHAALQYRLVPFEREDGTQGKRVRLYLIDLESANGTFLNNKKIDQRKYYELMEKDVIKFGFSTREYVLLHENSKEDQEDDDVQIKPEPEDIPDGPNP